MKIVISEYVHDDAVALLRDHHDVRYDANLFSDTDALKDALADAHAWIVRNQTRVTGNEHAPNLAVVGRVGVGLDNLDLDALRERDIVVTWAPGTNAVSVAEYVIGAMLSVTRRFDAISQDVHAGVWNRQAAMGGELYGQTLGIVGLGDIGTRLAKRAAAFGMNVIASDPAVHPSSFGVQEYGVALVPLTDLLAQSDMISLHTPLLPSTRHLIDNKTLAQMKPTALLINTARGGLIDETALAAALRDHRLGGAVLDVREQEPPGDADPLRDFANVILTPHIAGVTHESNRRASLHIAHDVLRVLNGDKPVSAVPLR
ncbi:MAG: hydroxyacid dehydrogenase [Trueperaceae bacterium]|nr:hydroxyacid dehydrogenase [Trueperaceae bacterium]